jgi:hypothetical protein
MDSNLNSDKSNIIEDSEFKCPNCKSEDVKKSINWVGDFYDCECRSCKTKFVIPIMGGFNYNVIGNKKLYIRNSKGIDFFGLNKDNLMEFLPISAFMAFSILAIVATVSANKFLSVPFAAVAGLSFLFYVFRRIRSRAIAGK